MDETANQIEVQIDRTRERLGSNLRELEDKVDAVTDWREHFRERPHLFLGAAFIGGIVLASALRPEVRGSRTIGGCTQPARQQDRVHTDASVGTLGQRSSRARRRREHEDQAVHRRIGTRALTSSIVAPSSGQRRSIRQQRRWAGPRVNAALTGREAHRPVPSMTTVARRPRGRFKVTRPRRVEMADTEPCTMHSSRNCGTRTTVSDS